MRDLIIVLVELIIALVFFCYAIKLLIKNKQTSSKQSNIKNDIRDGVKSAFLELEEEKEQKEILMKKLDQNREPDSVFSSIPEEEPINTGGYLIPSNLTDAEKEILRMFYSQ